MVLRRDYARRKIADNRSITGLFNLPVLILACVSLVGCHGTRADRVGEKLNCQLQELEVDEEQINHIRSSIQRLFQWEAYWKYNDNESKSLYEEKTRQPVSLEIFSLKRGVVVLIPSLGNSAVKFRKSVGGDLYGPRFTTGGVIRDGLAKVSFEGDKLVAIANALGDWREFILFTGKEIEKEPYRIPLLTSEDNMKRYIERNRGSIKYCQTDTEISLLPLDDLRYDPMDDRKQALLGAMVEESITLAKMMFHKKATVTITIPNFNINDGRIWILLEDSHEAYTMGMNMDVTNTNAPVSYIGTVEIRSSPKYGIRIGAEEKIRKAAIKTLKYKVE